MLKKLSHGRKIILVSSAIFISLLAMGILSGDIVLALNLVFIGLAVLTIPYSLYRFFEFKKVRAYEKEFPNFLRDLSESQRAGLTVLQAIKSAAKSDYGPLTAEIKRIDNQLSWNIPLEKVLNDWAKRMRHSRIIVRSIMIIHEANKSGGSIEDTMESLAKNIEMIKEVQEEKSSLLNQQVLMMYAIFFIFLGISIALLKFLIPLLQPGGTGGSIAGIFQEFNPNPCTPCISSNSPECLGCSLFMGVSSSLDFGPAKAPESYYRSLFLVMIIIQGFFSGLIAGQIVSDSVSAGIKHSLIMTLSGFFIFVLVIKAGFA
ncbi:MAG: type II secretion system F family protein [Candidatus Aenigmarchaeota archaeon]|nr:type II secretion system F family protein [Candidatus Aenigmarchaeota archaeon]